ncbi:uncharacterized protein LOC114335109 [Diabrotica virgifera virgifera]|uniref:Uncharacterized protein LOC114335109 n=1 Tax=Diabrotica virgifera virgifera TaxID=50390 RepID=A0A6P7G237_DIAVI|nr:uncharacterized protein LOC114335109 [Diabrotica virgifera virgifera]
MSKFSSFIELLVKQTCRRASHEFELESKQQSAPQVVRAVQDDVGIYSLEFLKALHDNTRDSLYKLIRTKDPNDPNSVEVPVGLNWLNNKDFTAPERKALLNFLYKVKDMAPSNSKNWIDLHHFTHYVYRNFASVSPDPTAEYLTPYFLDEMRGLVRSLIQEDKSQLYLRVLALLREYCIFAQWNYTKQEGEDHLITKLFYYYEAMLTAAKNLSDVFADIEVIIYSNYSICWIDFNTCVFIRYFLETDYVQQKIKQVLKTRVSPGDTPAMFALLEDLQKLWTREQNRIKKINDDLSLVEGTAAYYIEEAMISNHKKVLTTNFWMERTEQEKSDLDLRRLDHHLFRLLGDPYFHPAGPILDRNGQCICEECLVAKYDVMIHAVEEQSENKLLRSTSRLTFCRRCRTLLELDSFHRHVTDHAAADEVKAIIKDNTTKVGGALVLCEEPPEVSQRIPMPKEAADAALMTTCDIHFSRPKHDPNDLTCTRLAFEEFLKQSKDSTKHDALSNKNARRDFIKIKKDIFSNTGKVVFDDSILNPNTFASNLTPSVSPTKKKAEPSPKPKEIPKTSRKTERTRITSIKPPPKPSAYIPYDHLCKHVNEAAVCQGHSGMCDHQKEAKKCDCTYCEVFGTALSSHTHKNSELRDRLRNRLHQRREKRTKDTGKNPPLEANSAKIKTVISKVEERVPLPSSPTNIPPPAPTIRTTDSSGSSSASGSSASSPTSGSDDIHGLVSYIEGNLALTKMELAQKKAAKKARQRQKKEEERIKAEEEQKRREEENKIKEAEKKKELARKQAEREKSKAEAEAAAAQALKELKKKSKKERQAEKKRLLQQQKLEEEERKKIVEETIPAMVTIKRVAENGSSPTVTITLQGSTPEEEKLIYTLVKGDDDNVSEAAVAQEPNKGSKKKNKQKQPVQKPKPPDEIPQVVTKELKVTVGLGMNKQQNSESASTESGKFSNIKQLVESKKGTKLNDKKQNVSQDDMPIPMFRLPPGITITKIDGPVSIKNFQAANAEEQKGSSLNATKSGVIVVDTEKLIHKKQNNEATNGKPVSKTSKKKKKKNNAANKKAQDAKPTNASTEVKKMVTLKNPIFHPFQQQNPEPSLDKNAESCGPAAIFTNENGMVTIRSSRLQQSLSNGGSAGSVPLTTISNFAPEMQKSPIPSTVFTNSQMQDTKSDTMCPFYAQEILSGLPGIEITKVDKKTVKSEPEEYKSCQTAQVSIIPASTNGGEAFNFDNLDKDDWLFDSVFSPRDVLEDNMDPEELELEAFKRFCSQSIPPKRKEKVAHLNVADIVVKKKTNFY